MTKTMMQDAMSNESTERVKKVVNDYACKVHIFKGFFWFQDQFVLQGVSGFVDILTPPLTLDRMVQSWCPLNG